MIILIQVFKYLTGTLFHETTPKMKYEVECSRI